MKKSPAYYYRRNLPHILKPDAPHFVTWHCFQDRRLTAPERDIVFDHCLNGRGHKFHLHSFVVMPTHLHILFTPLRDKEADTFTLSEITKGIKGASARRINQAAGASGTVWQDESFDRVVRSEPEFEARMYYIMENPVAARLARAPHDYQWFWTENTQPSKKKS